MCKISLETWIQLHQKGLPSRLTSMPAVQRGVGACLRMRRLNKSQINEFCRDWCGRRTRNRGRFFTWRTLFELSRFYVSGIALAQNHVTSHGPAYIYIYIVHLCTLYLDMHMLFTYKFVYTVQCGPWCMNDIKLITISLKSCALVIHTCLEVNLRWHQTQARKGSHSDVNYVILKTQVNKVRVCV